MTLIPLDTHLRVFTERIDQSPCDGCDHCGTRCTTGIQVLRGEYEAAVAELRRLPSDEVERVMGQQKQLPIPGTEESYTACEFRDTERGQCLIYPARPTICRLFGHVEWLPCPIFKVETVVPGAIELMQSYATEPRKTFAEWAAGDGIQWPPRSSTEPTVECGGLTPLSSPVGIQCGVSQRRGGLGYRGSLPESEASEKSGVKPPHSTERCPVPPLSAE